MYVKHGYLWNQGVSLTQDRSAGSDVKRFFEALALFSPFQWMTTYLATGHEEGRCMMCHMPQCAQHLYRPTVPSSNGSCYAYASFQTIIPWLPCVVYAASSR